MNPRNDTNVRTSHDLDLTRDLVLFGLVGDYYNYPVYDQFVDLALGGRFRLN